MAIPERSELNPAFTWALEDLYSCDEAWQADFDWDKDYLKTVKAYEGRLGESAKLLLRYLELSDEIEVVFDKLANYAYRRADEDTRDSGPQAMCAQLTNFLTQLSTASSFATNEILAIPDETLEQFYKDLPGLEVYRRHLDNIRRRRAHILSPAEEKLLAMAGELSENPDNIFSMLNDADMKFADAVDAQGNPHALTHGTYIPMMHGSDRTLRKSAFDNLYAVYGQYRNTLAATLAAQAKQLWFFAQARKYPSALAAALDRTEVPEAVYHNLIAAVRENLPKMYRYVGLRKKLLGVEELHFYDLYADMVGDVEMKFPFEEAKEIALKALAPLGSDYGNILKEGFEERWIDVYENAGKRSGAYSAGTKVHPFVLLNYHDTLNDLFTLVHEMGHALHSELSNWNQPTVYSDYVIFVAEVASTCNEALLMEYLLKNTTDKPDQLFPGAVPHHSVPADHVRRVRGEDQPAGPERRGHHRRRVLRPVPAAEPGLLWPGHCGGRCHRSGVGPYPPLLLQLLRVPVRHRLRGGHRPEPPDSERGGAGCGGLPEIPAGRQFPPPHRAA